jgi:nitroreductase
MEFLELAKKRCSIRKYETGKVEEEKLKKILEAGRVAPTAANFQPQHMIVVKSQEGIDKLKKCANVYGAPLAIIVCGDHSTSWKRRFDGKDLLDVDVSIVTTHMMLQATELGLGTVWIGAFDPVIIKKEFNIPENVEPIDILLIGYPDVELTSPNRHDTARKPLGDLVHYEKY